MSDVKRYRMYVPEYDMKCDMVLAGDYDKLDRFNREEVVPVLREVSQKLHNVMRGEWSGTTELDALLKELSGEGE